eukprot:GHVT01021141.1.p1 GENE.GHVT01021141.1~~GHVT01021141.1.p1  ORF type:complete len:487 (-),score=125.35 GHVT01021141.1:745-2205(-)
MSSASDVAFQSREESRRQKELEEARKAGTAPAEKDEEGKEINPHIPQFISKAPWYLNQSAPGLRHQRYEEAPKEDIELWYTRGLKRERPTKFRKGACQNCGALTHGTKACVERPRAKGARFTGKEFCADEIEAEALPFGFDGKRDRWAGYDGHTHTAVIKEFEAVDVERKRRKALELQEKKNSRRARGKQKQKEKTNEEKAHDPDGDSDTDSDTDSECESGGSDEEDVKLGDFEKTSAPAGTTDARTRTTTRDLRIREDTAKYLLNLDLGSAFYDPKSRSMRQNPLGHLKEQEQSTFKGENEWRASEDVAKANALQVFGWDAYKHGANVHSTAQPTQLEMLHKEHQDKSTAFEDKRKRTLLNKYGGEEHLNAPKEIIYGQTETFIEYARDGSIIRRLDRALAKSKYEEDLHPGDHTSVWGSWFDEERQKWGFACCRALSRNAPCTGPVVGATRESSAPAAAAAAPASKPSTTAAAEAPAVEQPAQG